MPPAANPFLLAARACRASLARMPTVLDPDRLDARDPLLLQELAPLLDLITARYFRLDAAGLENIPDEPALFVSNHNGGIFGPDLVCTARTLWRELDRPLYALAHDFAMRQLPTFGLLAQRFGAIRARPENAIAALRSGGSVLVYPGGDLDAYRHHARRDHVVFGRRTGFVRVAREAGVPIVPIAVQGAHRSAYIFHEGETLARWLRLSSWARLERFPLALALPWGLAAGPWIPYLPLPFRIRMRILPPHRVAADADVEVVRDRVRDEMQRAVSRMAAGGPS